MADTLTDSTIGIATINNIILASEKSGSGFPEARVKNFSSDRVLTNPGVASHGMRVCVCSQRDLDLTQVPLQSFLHSFLR